MEDKITKVRNSILRMLLDGKLKEGEKLPSARILSRKWNISFVKVQQGLEELSKDGILYIAPRSGAYILKGWNNRILQNNLSFYNPKRYLGLLLPIIDIIREELPELRPSPDFPESVFEIRTIWALQRARNEYMDLGEFFSDLPEKDSMFFNAPFQAYSETGKLPGIPILFSPRVIFYNSEILKKNGCSPPHSMWSFDDFLKSIEILRKKLPAENIFHLSNQPTCWMNFVFRAGGGLISGKLCDDDIVKIDSPQTIRGFSVYRKIKDALGNVSVNSDNTEFFKGNMAFMMGARQAVAELTLSGGVDWGVVPFPALSDGKDFNTMAADLLCVRKNCTNPVLIKKFINVMLSEKVQDKIGALKFGIPIRKSSAYKSLNLEDFRDSVFIAESSKLISEYNLDSTEIAGMIANHINNMFNLNENIEHSTRKLADAVRVLIKARETPQCTVAL